MEKVANVAFAIAVGYLLLLLIAWLGAGLYAASSSIASSGWFAAVLEKLDDWDWGPRNYLKEWIIVVLSCVCGVLFIFGGALFYWNRTSSTMSHQLESDLRADRATIKSLTSGKKEAETQAASLSLALDDAKRTPLLGRASSSSGFSLSTVRPPVDFASLSSSFRMYPGHVNGFATTFALRWLTPTSWVGVFTRNGAQYTLAGANTAENQVFGSVNFNGRTVAYLKAKRAGNSWSGSMRVEDNGAITPIDFQATGNAVKTVTFENDTKEKVFICVGYLDNQQHLWTTKGYYSSEAGKSCAVDLPTYSNTYYYRATSSDNRHWDGEQKLAIGKNIGFTVRDADSRFPAFVENFASKNHDPEAEIETVRFAERSFKEGSNEAKIILTDN